MESTSKVFPVMIFLSPVYIGAIWSYGQIIGNIDKQVHNLPITFGIKPLLRYWKQHDVTNGGRYTAPCSALLYDYGFAPQLLLDDILYLIATYDYQVYGSMLVVNKSLNSMLKKFDAWGQFVEVVERRDNTDTAYSRKSYECIRMQIKGTQKYNVMGEPYAYICHGEMIETITEDRRHGRWSKRATHKHYRFDYEYKTEVYVYKRVPGEGEWKWKSWECVRIPGTKGDKRLYRIERTFNELGCVKETKHYRDGREYSPVGEFFENLIMTVVYVGAGALIGYSVWYNWPQISSKLAIYLSGNLNVLCSDIRWFFKEMDNRLEARRL
jgi:hypothetical protein